MVRFREPFTGAPDHEVAAAEHPTETSVEGPAFDTADAIAVLVELELTDVDDAFLTSVTIQLETTVDDGASWILLPGFLSQATAEGGGAELGKTRALWGPVGHHCRLVHTTSDGPATYAARAWLNRDD